MNDLDEICSMAVDFRRVWEAVLQNALKHQNTAGSCLYAAMLLSTSLSRFASCTTQVCGGDGQSGGLRDREGALRGHYWVEGLTTRGHSFVADVTADQFGYASVVVLPLAPARSVYQPGDQATVDEHVESEQLRCDLAMADCPA
jgi:hypothetical protein